MFVVIFEVHPDEGKGDEYLDHAKHLKPILESIDGYIDNERFENVNRKGWILSLSTWRDEKSVVRWRTVGEHNKIQAKGRESVFSDYRLRVCEVTADTNPPLAIVAQRMDETEIGAAKAIAITELTPTKDGSLSAHPEVIPSHVGLDEKAHGLVSSEIFESIYNPGKMLVLTAWETPAAAESWQPARFDGLADFRHRRARIIREYGMFERREAVKFYPPEKEASSPEELSA